MKSDSEADTAWELCENLSCRSALHKIEVNHTHFAIGATWIWNTKWWNPLSAPTFRNKLQDFLLVCGFVTVFQGLITQFLPSPSGRGALEWSKERPAGKVCSLLQASFQIAGETDVFLSLWLFSGSFLAGILPQFMASVASVTLCKTAADNWIHSLYFPF